MKSMRVMRESGAVSLFAVIFAMLLLTVVTVGFVRLMVNDQRQASNDDLSQSALDSAQAGVEDAKRALLRYKTVCQNNAAQCATALAALNSTGCNAAVQSVIPGGGSQIPDQNGNYDQVIVQQTSGDGADLLQQAYTCVKMQMETGDYVGTLTPNASRLIPLYGIGAFDQVTIEWFSLQDVSSGVTALNIPSSGQTLQSSWPTNRPSVLRAQLMQYGSSFNLESFDATSGGESNANTVFLYPHRNGAPQPIDLTGSADIRTSDPANESPADGPGLTPYPVQCRTTLANGGYACTATISMPQPVGGGNRTALLRLTPFYNATHFRVTLGGGAGIVPFDNVQPEIDSTGRANDLYRRVLTRVDMYDTAFPYPEAAVDITGNFCKDFGVTATQYVEGSPTCTP